MKSCDQLNLIEEIEVQRHLVLKKDGEDGPDVKGGEIDALIVWASKVQKISENGKFYNLHAHLQIFAYYILIIIIIIVMYVTSQCTQPIL